MRYLIIDLSTYSSNIPPVMAAKAQIIPYHVMRYEEQIHFSKYVYGICDIVHLLKSQTSFQKK